MRRILVVTTPGLAGPVREVLGAINGASIRVQSALESAPWAETDCLWLHDRALTSPELLPWLQAGGRLLATGLAAGVPLLLGLETIPPTDLSASASGNGTAPATPFALAGFGAHPLFAGMQQGAELSMPGGSDAHHALMYDGVRPDGAVVAVEWVGGQVHPARVLAWEYSVGFGGVLCIGTGVDPAADGQLHLAQLRALLGNALTGDGIPHRDRQSLPAVWPRAGRRVIVHDAAAGPALPGMEGEWKYAPGLLAAQSAPGFRWSATGRRGAVLGGQDSGDGEGWIHPFRVLQDMAIAVGGTPAAVLSCEIRPEQIERRLVAGSIPAVDRWMSALEHPLLYWEVSADGEAPLVVEWTSDLRRAWPYPAGCCGDLQLSLSPDGSGAVLRAEGDPFRLLIDVDGGFLTATPVEGPAVRFSVRATGRCRIRLAGAADDADLDRSRQVLTRRSFSGLHRQRREHARELAAYLTSTEGPDPFLGTALEWAKVLMDGCMAGSPGVGRGLAAGSGAPRADGDRPGPWWYGGEAGCRLALAQLVVGDRAGPRDTLKFLSLTQNVDGRIVERCSTSGLAEYGASSVIPAYLMLAAHYGAWTGELDFLARRWGAVRRALGVGMAARPWEQDDGTDPWRPAFDALLPLAESLGHQEDADRLAALSEAARPRAEPATIGATPVAMRDFQEGRLESGLSTLRTMAEALAVAGGTPADGAAFASLVVNGLWGVEANALEGAVRIAPWFPPEWDSMALDRLRIGKAVLSIRLRRRFGQVAAQVERVHGPRVHVELALRGGSAADAVLLDDVELRGGRVAFEADGRHALLWHH